MCAYLSDPALVFEGLLRAPRQVHKQLEVSLYVRRASRAVGGVHLNGMDVVISDANGQHFGVRSTQNVLEGSVAMRTSALRALKA